MASTTADTAGMSESALVVRRATPCEREAVIALYDDVIEKTEGKAVSPLWVKGLHPSEEEIDAAMADGTMFVGLIEGRVAAVLIANTEAAPGYEDVPWSFDAAEGEAAIIHLFAVSPALQRGGLGSQFIWCVFQIIEAEGHVKGIRLDTLEQNVPAYHFYHKLGMNYLGVHTLTYHDPRVKRFHLFDLAFPLRA